jgi:hypothetical protein
VSGTAPVRIPGPLLVDAHAHLHRVFDLSQWLSSAASNVAAGAVTAGAPGAVGVMLLADPSGESAFMRLRSAADAPPGRWSISLTAESESLLVSESGHPRLVVIAGRQIVTAEGVEVLALLSAEQHDDGRPLRETIAGVSHDGAIPVLPWGFGKWTMRRGALVEATISSSTVRMFLGDNGGRLGLGSNPHLFREGAERRMPILPGSDPLPFGDQVSRVASYGFVASTDLDAHRPAYSLRTWLRGLETSPPAYGSLESLGRFLWNQSRMQWRKRVLRPV